MPAVDPMPLVSVVIPTRDQPEFLARALASCGRCGLGPGELEVIVVDDGSSDAGAVAVCAAEFGARLLRYEVSRGRAAARNGGLEVASGRYVKFLDHDDLLEAGALAREARRAEATGAEIVISDWRISGPAGENAAILSARWTARGADSLLAGEAVPTGAALYRRGRLGDERWDGALLKLDDWDFFVRAVLSGGRVVVCPGVAYTWVTHPMQASRKASRLVNAREFYLILDRIEAHLAAAGELTDARRERLAQYLYKELQLLAEEDVVEFERRASQIEALDRNFVPRDEEPRWWVRWACRLLGLRGGLTSFIRLKRWIRR